MKRSGLAKTGVTSPSSRRPDTPPPLCNTVGKFRSPKFWFEVKSALVSNIFIDDEIFALLRLDQAEGWGNAENEKREVTRGSLIFHATR